MSRPIAALLYSPQSQDPVLLQLIDRIRQNPGLGLRLISTDRPEVRHLLRHNESGISVTQWPVFAIKQEQDPTPTIYPISAHEEVFELLRPSKVLNWDRSAFKRGPVVVNVAEGDCLRLPFDVVLADQSWRPVQQLGRQLVVDRTWFNRGRCYLRSSRPEDGQMRLILQLPDCTDDIIDGIGDCSEGLESKETDL